MSKPIAYPSPIVPAYKGLVSEMRTYLNILARMLRSRPGAKDDAAAQISARMNEFSISPSLPGTQRIVTSGVKVTAPAITGTYVNGYTFTIVGGVITGIVAS